MNWKQLYMCLTLFMYKMKTTFQNAIFFSFHETFKRMYKFKYQVRDHYFVGHAASLLIAVTAHGIYWNFLLVLKGKLQKTELDRITNTRSRFLRVPEEHGVYIRDLNILCLKLLQWHSGSRVTLLRIRVSRRQQICSFASFFLQSE